MTTLRDKAIAGIEAAVRATFANVDAWNDGYGRGYAAGMAAGRRPRDDEARDAGKALDARLLPESDKEYCRRIEEIAAGGHPLVELPRDDEARIERAARAMFYDKFPDGSDALWEHLCAGFLRSARAALAAADQEDTT